MEKQTQSESIKQYVSLQTAYDMLNDKFWGGKLPQVLLTLQRKRGAKGYFSPERFVGRSDEGGTISEVALNPDTFRDRSDREIISTLLHEATHVWQFAYGEPSRGGYHNKEWATEMKRVGLQPTTTGEPDGKEVGAKVTHFIIEGGVFDTYWAELEKAGVVIRWESAEGKHKAVVSKERKASKVKYSCPGCDLNCWAKPEVTIKCGLCNEYLEPEK